MNLNTLKTTIDTIKKKENEYMSKTNIKFL